MWLLRFLFAPELGRALVDIGGASRRFGRSVRALSDGMSSGERSWRRLLDRERRARTILGAALASAGLGLVALGAAGLAAGSAHAQTIDPEIFATSDSATRDLLAFLSDVGVARHAVLGDMLFVFNGGVLVLAGFLLLWHTVAGTVDTARTGRWGFGAWEIVRVVVADLPIPYVLELDLVEPRVAGDPERVSEIMADSVRNDTKTAHASLLLVSYPRYGLTYERPSRLYPGTGGGISEGANAASSRRLSRL